MTKEELQQAHYDADIDNMVYAEIFAELVTRRDLGLEVSDEKFEVAKKEWMQALKHKKEARQAVIDFGMPKTKPEKGVVYNFVTRKIIE